MSCWRAEKARQLNFYPALQKGCGFAAYSHFGRVLNPPLRLFRRIFSLFFAKSFNRICRGRLSWRPAVLRNSLRISHFSVQRFRRGRRPRRPVPVNHRAVNQRWTGRPGGRPLRKRKNESLRNSMVRWAAVGGGPYGAVGLVFVNRQAGRPGVRPAFAAKKRFSTDFIPSPGFCICISHIGVVK